MPIASVTLSRIVINGVENKKYYGTVTLNADSSGMDKSSGMGFDYTYEFAGEANIESAINGAARLLGRELDNLSEKAKSLAAEYQ